MNDLKIKSSFEAFKVFFLVLILSLSVLSFPVFSTETVSTKEGEIKTDSVAAQVDKKAADSESDRRGPATKKASGISVDSENGIASDEVVMMPELPEIYAEAYVLMDASSGYIIASHNMNEKIPPASLTKMMTSYLVSEKIAEGELKLSERVGVSRKASADNFPGGSRMWLSAGEKVTADDLQRGLVVASGNDAAIALAEHIGPNVENFVDLMNQKADELGMLNTQFKNPHGLPQKEHYSSAYDLALLARALVWDFPEDYFLYREKTFNYKGVTQNNRNTLLWDNPYIDGIKTGYTDEAGYCLAASALKDNMRLIAIVLGTKDAKARTWEAQKLLSYGFQYYRTYLIYKANEVIESHRAWKGAKKNVGLGVNKDVYLTLPRGKYEKIDSNIVLDDQITAPVEEGVQLGNLLVTLESKEILKEPVYAMENIEETTFLGRIWDGWVSFFFRVLG